MKQNLVYISAIIVLVSSCCSTKKVLNEQKESKMESKTDTFSNEQINTFISTSINENEELVYTKVEFFPNDNVIVGADISVCPNNDDRNNQQIKSVENLTKRKTKQTSQNIKQNSDMKQQSKEKIKANSQTKTTEIKETKTPSSVKYYLLLFALVIGVLVWLKFRKWFNSKNK